MELDEFAIIGVFNDYDDTRLISVGDLIEYTQECNSHFSLKQYFDRRCSTNLSRFNFDPFTGKKINWSELKRYEEKYIEA